MERCGYSEIGISQIWFVSSRRVDCSLLLVSKRKKSIIEDGYVGNFAVSDFVDAFT